jgi:polysaccharide biosynthesis transport protein
LKAGRDLPSDPFDAVAPEPESDFNAAEYLAMVRRHWKLVLAACFTALAGAAAHYAVTPKQYLATALIQIERRSLAPVLNNQAPWLESYFDLEYYPTQYKLLESRGLAERVVKNLDLVEDPAWNPSRATLREASPGSVAGGIGFGNIAGMAGGAGKGAAVTAEDQTVLGALAERLRGGLTVDPVRNTQLVQLSYRSASPEFAAKAANSFAEAFIDMGIENRFTSAGKTSTFLGSQIETLRREIDDKQAKIRAFSRRTKTVPMEPGTSVTLKRLEALNAEYIEAKKQRIDKEAAYHELLSAPRETVADTLAVGVVGGMRADQLKLEREYETKLKTYKPDWPAMVALKAEIDKGQQHLTSVMNEVVETAKKSAFSAYQTALRQEQGLEAEITKQKSEAVDQSSDSVEYNNLLVEIKTRSDLLNELLRKQSENDVQARLQDTRDTNIHIVDHALVPGGPFQPSLRKDLTYGLLLGLLLGVSVSLLIEFLDRTLKSPEEIERHLALPTLAVIQDIAEAGKSYGYERYGYGYGYGYGESPRAAARVRPASAAGTTGGGGKPASRSRLERKKRAAPDPGAAQIELVPHERPRTPISEAYRALRTALLLSSAHELKVVAVTSAVAGEGKTATATNLAIVLAQLGRPVLIIDSDLRKPRLHQVFKVSNQVGLVSHLTHSTAQLEDVFLPTQVPNLWVTPSGPIPPNPSELLASDRMREILKQVRERFEYVIVDTPPTLAVTDSTIVGALADGVILTLRTAKVMRDEARMCRDRLRSADVRILGAVLNRYRAVQAGTYRRYRAYEMYAAEEVAPKAGSAA